MLKVSFWVEVANQLSGYETSVSAANVAEVIEKTPYFMYDGYGLAPFSFRLEKEGKFVCKGTYDNIVEKLKRME